MSVADIDQNVVVSNDDDDGDDQTGGRSGFLFIASSPLNRQETVEQLLSNIFDKEKSESAIVSVIQILLTLFETRRPA